MTQYQKYLLAFCVGIFIAGALALSFLIGRRAGYSRGWTAALCLPRGTDTCWVVDTHFVDRPVEVWREREKLVFLPVHDSTLVVVRDTTYVVLERERKGYSGDDYQLEITGVEPVLEWIKVFPKTAYITNTVVEKKRWGFGVTAGPGILYDGTIHGGVGIVAGATFNF